MSKKFIAYLTSGLGNRLRPLASAMAYCEQTGRELLVYWDNVTPNGCLTPLDKLFKNKFKQISLEEIAEIEGSLALFTEKGKGHGVQREADRFGRDQLLKLSQCSEAQFATDVMLDCDADVVIVYDNNYIPAIPKAQSIEQLRKLEPLDSIVEQVKSLVHSLGFKKGLKGVHARGTDFGLSQALEMYAGMIANAININAGEKFFLSTDDADLEKGLIKLFPSNVITRDNRLHLQLNQGKDSWFDPDSFTISEQHGMDALTDIYLLSCTDLVVYHPASTFGEISRHLHAILWEKDTHFWGLNVLSLPDIKKAFQAKVMELLPRKDQNISLDLSAAQYGPAFLESTNQSFVYLETLGYNIPILERMLFSGSSKPTLEWDGDLFSKLSAIPYQQFPFELFTKLCPYPEAIPQLQNVNPYIKDRKVLIIGSEHPWLELFCAISGAKKITTVEYRPITWQGGLSTQCEMETVTWEHFENNITDYAESYDLIITYSSIEYSGLGRYGDPLTPLGDLYTFMLISKCLASHGMCMVAVPVGQDLTHFNAHRIYGSKRILALAHTGDLKYIGIVTPTSEYYQQNEKDETLKAKGWSLATLAQLPLGQYRQPLLCFAHSNFSVEKYFSQKSN